MKRVPKLAHAMRYHTDAELREMAAAARTALDFEDVFGLDISLDGFRPDVWASAIQYEQDRRRFEAQRRPR